MSDFSVYLLLRAALESFDSAPRSPAARKTHFSAILHTLPYCCQQHGDSTVVLNRRYRPICSGSYVERLGYLEHTHAVAPADGEAHRALSRVCSDQGYFYEGAQPWLVPGAPGKKAVEEYRHKLAVVVALLTPAKLLESPEPPEPLERHPAGGSVGAAMLAAIAERMALDAEQKHTANPTEAGSQPVILGDAPHAHQT